MNYINCANRFMVNTVMEIIMTLIDLSGSMKKGDWKPTRMAGAVAANKELVRAKAEAYPLDRMGIIGFGTDAEVLQDPVAVGTGTQSLYRALDSVVSMGETNITEALELAGYAFHLKSESAESGNNIQKISKYFSDLLYGTQHNESQTHVLCDDKGLTRRIILLSDGGHNANGRSPIKRAGTLKDAGVVIDCIGIGNPSDIDEETLKKIASCNPDGSVRYSHIGDKHQLIKKYESLAHHIRPA